MEVRDYPYCFGCGDSNPKGLGLKLRLDGETLKTEFVPQEEHQGWPGIVYGGIILSLLYEVLENFHYYKGQSPMMKSVETRFCKPANIGEKIIAKSWADERDGREVHVEANLTDESGGVIAEGKAVLVILNQEQRKRLGIT